MRRGVKEVGWAEENGQWSDTHLVVIEFGEDGRSYVAADLTFCGVEIEPNSGVFAMGPNCRDCAVKARRMEAGT